MSKQKIKNETVELSEEDKKKVDFGAEELARLFIMQIESEELKKNETDRKNTK